MRFERSLIPVLLVATWAGAAAGQAGEALGPSPSCRGAVTVEVERRLPLPLPRAVPPPLGGLSGWSSRIGVAPDLEWATAGEVVAQRGVGWVVRSDGVVAVPAALIQEATNITVTLGDGRRLSAERVETDPATQVSLLRIAGRHLPATPVGTNADLLPGAEVTLSGLCSEDGCSHPTGTFVTQVPAGRGSLVCLLNGRPSGSSGLSWLLDSDGRAVGVSPRLTKLPLPVGGALWIATLTPVESLKARIDQVPPQPAPLVEPVEPWDWLWNEPNWPAPWEWSWAFPPQRSAERD